METALDTLHQALRVPKLGRSPFVKVTQETSVLFFRHESKIWLCRSHTPRPHFPSMTWNKLAKYVVSMTHHNTSDSRQTLHCLISTLFSHRHNTAAWLLTPSWITHRPQKPPLPVDCLHPTQFLLTASGCVPWHPQLKLPNSLDYRAYLTLLNKFLNASQGSTDPLVTQEDADNLLKLLLLS